MANSRPNVQLLGFPVKLRDEQEVPGFRVRPPEEEVPGFRMNADGSVRLPTRQLMLRLQSSRHFRTRRWSRESARSLA